MALNIRNSIKRYAPAYAEHPVRLAWSLLRHPNKAARSAVAQAALGMLLWPIDALMAGRESCLYQDAGQPEQAVILVCGPPRSGTSLVAQYMINCLDVSYIDNLNVLFPRSPLMASRNFGFLERQQRGEYNAFYGKSRGLSGNNDGLPIWDRWLGEERDLPVQALSSNADPGMANFFAAMQSQTGKAVVNKVNRLMCCADQVAPLMPNARFVIMQRDPLSLAQSLLVARDTLLQNREARYGLHDGSPILTDPVEDVAHQAEWLLALAADQAAAVGPERALLLNYEDFCTTPHMLINHIREQWQLDIDQRQGAEIHRTFRVSDRAMLSDEDRLRLQQRLQPQTSLSI